MIENSNILPSQKLNRLIIGFLLFFSIIGFGLNSEKTAQGQGSFNTGSLNINGEYPTQEILVKTIGCSVNELVNAINFANSNPETVAIKLAAGCTYQINKADNVDPVYLNNGLPVITSSIIINGNGAVLLSANSNLRAFQVAQSGKLFLDNVEFRNFSSADEGGAILNQGHLNVGESTFNKNTGSQGGAVYNIGQALIYNSTFYFNSASC